MRQLRIQRYAEPVQHASPARLDAVCELPGHVLVSEEELAAPGASRRSLLATAAPAMRAWPEAKPESGAE